MPETILIVDDEEPVRKTFREWLEGSDLDGEILTAADAEAALHIANQRTIDLAILDWNLGAGNDGLQLLEDLYVFNPDVVAIMITGYAHQATPLDAMRMGVRDYLDKSQDLHRDSFLEAVRKQLERIRPAKRERQLHRSLVEFRESVEKILPLVSAAATLNEPVPFTESVRSLFRFLMRTTGATDGALLVRSYDADREPAEIYRAYRIDGEPLDAPLLPFSQSLASTVVSMQEPCALAKLDESVANLGVRLQPFEQNHRSLLAAPLTLAPGLHVVLELFDKATPHPSPLSQPGRGAGGEGGFTESDRRLVGAVADFGAEMLKQALADRQSHGLLFDAVQAALQASEQVTDSLASHPSSLSQLGRGAGGEGTILDQVREGLRQSPIAVLDADQSVKLAELLRLIATRHGREATEYCIQVLDGIDQLLRRVTGSEEARP